MYKKGTPEYEAWILTPQYKTFVKKCSDRSRGEKNPMSGKHHTVESTKKMSESKIGKNTGKVPWNKGKKCPQLSGENNGNFGKVPWNKGKKCPQLSGENHPMFGRTGEKHPMFGRTGEKHPWFGRHHTPEACKRMAVANSGENNGNWRNGASFEPYCPKFNPRFKKRVRARYNRICVECEKTTEENGQELCAHHVDFDKQTCCKEGEKITDQKFVALCVSCHSYASNHIEWAIEHYTKIVDEKYGGKSYLTEDEMKKYIEIHGIKKKKSRT